MNILYIILKHLVWRFQKSKICRLWYVGYTLNGSCSILRKNHINRRNFAILFKTGWSDLNFLFPLSIPIATMKFLAHLPYNKAYQGNRSVQEQTLMMKVKVSKSSPRYYFYKNRNTEIKCITMEVSILLVTRNELITMEVSILPVTKRTDHSLND